MSTKNIFLLCSTPEILQLYSDTLSKNGCRVVVSPQIKPGSRKKKISPPLVIVELKDNWVEDLTNLHATIADSSMHIIVGSSKRLKEDLSRINEISRLIFDKNQNITSKPKKSPLSGAFFIDLLEEKISEFVSRVKSAGGKDLYPLLIREIEKPLIKVILKETGGNQIKAAQMLGMNRNTLRKKMKGLRLTPPDKVHPLEDRR